jgi:[ribosomal protein S5]-alanine N-acetyltransferase
MDSRLFESERMTHNRIQSKAPLLNPPVFEDIKTPRLDLVAAIPEALQCEARGGENMRAELGEILQAEVPSAWPHEHWEPHVFQFMLDLIAKDPEAIGWCRYAILRQGNEIAHPRRILIGTVGSLLPKPETREAEIGYGLLPDWQRQGFAPEAVAAMLPWLQTRREIRAFVAQTFPHLRGSIRVLEKNGFHHAGAGFEEGTILFRRECPSSAIHSE